MLQPSSPVQSTYQQYLTVAQKGTPATMTGWDVDTKIFEDASPPVGLGFGLAVSQGDASDRAVKVGAPSGKAFIGISRADPTLPNIDPTFTDKYQDGDNVAVFVRGDIWVVAEGHVVAGEAVYFNGTTGALGHSGGTLIEDARWMTTASASGLAVVRLGNSAGGK